MKKILTSISMILLLLTSLEAEIEHTSLFDTTKGQESKGLKLYKSQIKESCNFINGWEFANKHNQDEWESHALGGTFKDEISKICIGLDKPIKNDWLPDLYQFVYNNAKDSGVVPWSFYL